VKRFRPFLVPLALLGCAAGALAQELPPPEDPPPELTTPASDKEETGALTDTLPDRVELLVLPAEDEDEPVLTAEERWLFNSGSLFPAELWQGAPMVPPEPPDTSAAPEPPASSLAGESMPPEIVASCFGPGPPPPLHDPQALLPPAQAAPLLALLRDSLNARGSFLTSVIVLKPSQQIPVELNPAELLQRWHGDAKGLLVLYFLGQPERTQAFFTPGTRHHHRSEDLRQVIDFGVREAARLNAPVAQLQRFCYKTAIRLDRLHRQGVVTPSDEPAAAAAASVESTGLWWAFAVGVQAAALAAGSVWWLRRRRSGPGEREGKTIRFPDQDLVSRLGAPHCGGAGAVIQFGVTGQRL